MDNRVASYYLSLFLKMFSVLLLLPVAVGKLYGESFVSLEGFIFAAFTAIVLGYLFGLIGKKKKPSAIEAMMAATAGWLIAVGIGAIPFMTLLNWGFVDAFFEAMSGFTTTGMSILLNLEGVPRSLIFWRAFIQWVGGLGILTFFVTVVVEAGGAVTSFVSVEANKTDAGSIRPSLFNAIRSLWYIYIIFTAMEIILLMFFDMGMFNSVMYSLTTMPTGGFSSSIGGLAAFDSLGIEVVVTLFMIAGGTNFLLLYRMITGDPASLFKDYEFRLYMKVMAVAIGIVALDLVFNSGMGIVESVRSTVFHIASVTSSTGFELTPVHTFPELSRLIFLVLMFIGGSLGSTTGGFKMFRLGVMFKLVAREIKSFTLPRNALNKIMVKGKEVRHDSLMRIVAIFFISLAVIVLGGIVTVAYTDLTMIQGFQGMVSSIGTMGPVFMSEATLAGLPGVVKIFWALGMLAGRLEMLPILVLLNVEIIKRFSR